MTRAYLREVGMLLAFLAPALGAGRIAADDASSPPNPGEAAASAEPQTLSVEQLTESVRRSVVVVTVTGRDGKQQALGSGFVVAADGLIATNLHVIGEGRPITVQTADGKKYDATAVHAFDRPLDLALIRISAGDLAPLPLGDSSSLKQGQPIVAIGSPLGLNHSVVTGVVSGTREIEGRQMIQLAVPIEQGNSGGPLLDMQGRVHGLLTMKSAVTQNLGFAMPINALKPLIDKPNPTLMSRWLTIGALDPREWRTLFGANWRQRAGRILVDGVGSGFGGRSLCLAQTLPPEPPFEIGVTVKLDREEGAAGLVFCSDGGDVHYGFYPSNGNLRLSRFDGPDVYSWAVLTEVKNASYRPGEWNSLKVRFEKGRIQCFVNDVPAIESTDRQLSAGKVGLAKFRATEAQFRSFRVGKELAVTRPADEVAARISRLIDELPPGGGGASEAAAKLADDAGSVGAIRERAAALELQAQQLKKLAQSVHQHRVEKELARLFDKPADDDVDLFQAALLVAFLDNDEVDIEAYRRELDRMASEITRDLAPESDEAKRLAALDKYLFDEHGFHGSRGDYGHRSNSYVNEVLDDREGLPITLSVIYIELARKIGLKVVGLGLPGHFMVRFEPSRGDSQIIDVFDRGQPVSREAAEVLIKRAFDRPATEADFAAAGKRAIIVRMLHNLRASEQRAGNIEGMLRYQGAIVAVAPAAGEERFARAVLLLQSGRHAEAAAEADWLLQNRPPGANLNEVDELRRVLERINRDNR